LDQLTPDIAQRLQQARTGHLATADLSGAPHVVPVCFACDGSAIYSVLDQKPKRTSPTRLRRVRNLQANPQVSLVVDHYQENWRGLWYVLVQGRADLLLEGPEQERAIKLLREKYPQYRGMDIDGNPVIKIAPTRVVAWSAAGQEGG
jgi:coenzyme F420-0:L-glutamate ligase / coenzyme F420-1:gamma-L-glutamate ligase